MLQDPLHTNLHLLLKYCKKKREKTLALTALKYPTTPIANTKQGNKSFQSLITPVSVCVFLCHFCRFAFS